MIETNKSIPQNIDFYDFQPKLLDFKTEVINGLSHYPKFLPPKLFYDSRGSQLFEQITGLPEYYITSVEKAIMLENTFAINQLMGENILLIEPGSGNGEKARRIFATNKSIEGYIPIEISREFLLNSAIEMAEEFSHIRIMPICADYLNDFALPDIEIKNRTVFFPGSSIGNYDPAEALNILRKFTGFVNNPGGLLIGVDLKKDPNIIELAYNDPSGITAEFNLNLLHRIKNELKADLDINNFYHKSFYNEKQGRIEMYLVSKKDYNLKIAGKDINFAKNEKIHTENSYKYTVEEFKTLGLQAGYKSHNSWTDIDNYFSVHYFKV